MPVPILGVDRLGDIFYIKYPEQTSFWYTCEGPFGSVLVCRKEKSLAHALCWEMPLWQIPKQP